MFCWELYYRGCLVHDTTGLGRTHLLSVVLMTPQQSWYETCIPDFGVIGPQLLWSSGQLPPRFPRVFVCFPTIWRVLPTLFWNFQVKPETQRRWFRIQKKRTGLASLRWLDNLQDAFGTSQPGVSTMSFQPWVELKLIRSSKKDHGKKSKRVSENHTKIFLTGKIALPTCELELHYTNLEAK